MRIVLPNHALNLVVVLTGTGVVIEVDAVETVVLIVDQVADQAAEVVSKAIDN